MIHVYAVTTKFRFETEEDRNIAVDALGTKYWAAVHHTPPKRLRGDRVALWLTQHIAHESDDKEIVSKAAERHVGTFLTSYGMKLETGGGNKNPRRVRATTEAAAVVHLGTFEK